LDLYVWNDGKSPFSYAYDVMDKGEFVDLALAIHNKSPYKSDEAKLAQFRRAAKEDGEIPGLPQFCLNDVPKADLSRLSERWMKEVSKSPCQALLVAESFASRLVHTAARAPEMLKEPLHEWIPRSKSLCDNTGKLPTKPQTNTNQNVIDWMKMTGGPPPFLNNKHSPEMPLLVVPYRNIALQPGAKKKAIVATSYHLSAVHFGKPKWPPASKGATQEDWIEAAMHNLVFPHFFLTVGRDVASDHPQYLAAA